ncbi:hypothetical protein B0F90DRAFT_613806 [Multifurca ochricompacta]|uniref:Uncharacterized protein n=1 Tax=Multifurca ochricompacta TaxID=376703 RepID=A0AAD4QMR7_9AGAM|nr:hypothetical protein B0F90DRAFT_613806 [Multifurca ochricompacta]
MSNAQVAAVGAIWSLTYTISLFQELSIDRSQHQKRLATFAIVLGSLYAGTTAIFLFGIVAAATKRLALIRIFSFLSAAATVIVIGTGFLRTIVHFMLKDGLIGECTALAQGHDAVFRWGIWTTNPKDKLTPDEAARFCKKAWNQDSFSEIFWLIGEIILMSLFTVIVFSYAQQETTLVTGGARTRLPTTYTPAYAAGPGYAAGIESTVTLPEVPYNQTYAPPPGPHPLSIRVCLRMAATRRTKRTLNRPRL